MATLNSNISLLVVTPGIYQVQPAAEGLFRSEFYVQIQLWPAHHERGAPILRQHGESKDWRKKEM
ncbi:hypothetical protein MSG28_007886, partial [Choristoneura fumiferana]